jgi:hypothetical protein
MTYNDTLAETALIQRLEKSSRDILERRPRSVSKDDIELLNRNTLTLNRKINSYRKVKAESATKSNLPATIITEIRARYVPREIHTDFDAVKIKTIRDFARFVILNQEYFRNVFPAIDSKVVSLANGEKQSDSVLDSVIVFVANDILRVFSEAYPDRFVTFDAEYPSLATRTKTGPITAPEVDALIKDNGLDPVLFEEQIENSSENIFQLTESSTAKLGIGANIIGPFCALVDDVFALSKGQRDLTGNSSQFLGNFTNVLGLINPNVSEITQDVQDLLSLMTGAQQASVDTATNFQDALSNVAGSLGISLNFADVLLAGLGETGQPAGIEVDWNLEAISTAISLSDPIFATLLETTGKPIGDINQDGTYDAADSIALTEYIDSTANSSVIDYIEKTFLPYLNENAVTFSSYSSIPSAAQPESSMPDILSTLISATNSIGAGPGEGDFGISKITEAITIATGISSSIQSLISDSKPVNIAGLLTQLDQIIDLGSQAVSGMFSDINNTSDSYRSATENSLLEAEVLAVDEPQTAADISTAVQESLSANVTEAIEVSAENSKNLGHRLIEAVNAVRNGIRQMAAVGVLEDLNTRLSSVVDESASSLRSRVGLMTPNSIGNGFNANLISSFGRMAGLISQASAASSEESTAAMRDSVTGMIAQSSERYRQRSKEEVEFVALRFCKLAGEIERIYRDVTLPVEQMTSNFVEADRILSSTGSDVTLRALQSGALRLDTQARIDAMTRAGTIAANQSSPFFTQSGVRTNVPPQGTYPIDVVPPLPGDYEFPTYEDALAGRGGVLYSPGPSSSLSGRAGFIAKSAGGGVDTDALRRLYMLAQRWGQTIRINSAYRSPAANANAGGATNSYHMTGKAFDCGISGRSNQIRFMNLAYQIGFRGFGTYSTFTHIDTRGGTSSWGEFRYYDLPGPPGAKVG